MSAVIHQPDCSAEKCRKTYGSSITNLGFLCRGGCGRRVGYCMGHAPDPEADVCDNCWYDQYISRTRRCRRVNDEASR